ncbi:hypothetical protein BBJ28_00006470 [Nothophytophthora sp. Chile5]|nr:hypothetical protein BBJ28_00006470 [Nothophytophthora sp. Chile5]
MHGLRFVRRHVAADATFLGARSVPHSGSEGASAIWRGLRSYHSKSTPVENAALLRELEAALKRDPGAAQHLSTLLSPSTARGLAKALNKLRHPSSQSTADVSITAGAAVGAVVRPPSMQELKLVALQVGLPFIGFGFVDNLIMIVAGDYIDLTLGVSLGISSMAAAGIGNTISDVAGLGLGNVVEDFCARLGLPVPALTSEQMMLKQTRWAKVVGSSVGVTIGCLLGMVPLLFLSTRENHDKGKLDKPDVAVGSSSE